LDRITHQIRHVAKGTHHRKLLKSTKYVIVRNSEGCGSSAAGYDGVWEIRNFVDISGDGSHWSFQYVRKVDDVRIVLAQRAAEAKLRLMAKPAA
jgi:hypothetical protein